MKIGTLTIMLPTNYGNALQMLSLSKYLAYQGHCTEILNHWASSDKREIYFWHSYSHESSMHKIAFLLSCLTWTGKACAWLRESKIKKWIDRSLVLSEATGVNGKFPMDKMDYDAVIVGSDQIWYWHPGCKTQPFFLLEGFPERLTKISYAASFNSGAFPAANIEIDKMLLDKFRAISVRESSSVELFRDKFSITPKHVCDPTLFHTKDEWRRLLQIREHHQATPSNMMYIVSPDGQKYYDDAIRIARETKRKLHVFAFACCEESFTGKNALKVICETIVKRMKLYMAGVRLHFSATPTEFVQQLSDSECVFTDSFHGMIFSTIFEKRCNVIVGNHKERQGMKAKLLDFARDYGDPRIITERFDTTALQSLTINENLKSFITASKQWLADALKK